MTAAVVVLCWIACMAGDRNPSLFSLLLLPTEWIALLCFLPILTKSRNGRETTEAVLTVLLPAASALFICREYALPNLLCLLLCAGLMIGCVRFLPDTFRAKNCMILLTCLIPMLSFVLRCRLFAKADAEFAQLAADRLCGWLLKMPDIETYIGRWIDRGWMSRPHGYGAMPFSQLMQNAVYAREAALCIGSFLKRALSTLVCMTAARWSTAFGIMAFLRQTPDHCVRVFQMSSPQGKVVAHMPCSFVSLIQSAKVNRILMLSAAACLLVCDVLPESAQNTLLMPAVMLLTYFTLQGAGVIVFLCALKRAKWRTVGGVMTGIWFFLWPLSVLLTCLGLFETIVPIRMKLLLKEAKERYDAAMELRTAKESKNDPKSE